MAHGRNITHRDLGVILSTPVTARDTCPLPVTSWQGGTKLHAILETAALPAGRCSSLLTWSSHPQFSQEGFASICVCRQIPESPELTCWHHHSQSRPRVHGVQGNKSCSTSPSLHHPLLQADLIPLQVHDICLGYAEPDGEKRRQIKELGGKTNKKKSLFAVLKSRACFLCYFYTPLHCLSLRSLVANRRVSEKAQQPKELSCNHSPASNQQQAEPRCCRPGTSTDMVKEDNTAKGR